MPTAWLKVVALVFALAASGAAFDRLDLEATLADSGRVVTGTVSVEFGSVDSSWHDLLFRLYWNFPCDDPRRRQDSAGPGPCGMEIGRVTINGVERTDRIVIESTDLRIPLDSIDRKSGPVGVSIDFVGHVPMFGPDYGLEAEGYLLYGWFPMPAPRRANEWVRARYNAEAELAADCYDIHVALHVPDTLELASPGVLARESSNGTTTYRCFLPGSHDFPACLLPEAYDRDTLAAGAVRLPVWIKPGDRPVLDSAVSWVEQTTAYLNEQVGAYPFDELAIVIGGPLTHGGLELPRLIIVESPGGFFSPALYRSLVVHETVHEWFYGVLNSDQASHPWMDEAVTEYFTERVIRHMTGGTGDRFSFWGFTASFQDMRRLTARELWSQVPVTWSSVDYGGDYQYFGAVYNKGCLVVQNMVNVLSDADRRTFWREYFRQFAFRSPTPDDFVDLLSQYEPYENREQVWSVLQSNADVDYAVDRIDVRQGSSSLLAGDSSTRSEAHYISTVVCTFRHVFDLPVVLRVALLDGTTRDTTITPQIGVRRYEFAGPSPAACATVDPEYRNSLDVNLLNNSRCAYGDTGVALRLTSGATFVIQSLLSFVWGF